MALSAEPSTQTETLIGIVVGESSGDLLGAGLMRALKQIYPNARFEGIGGPLMTAEGFNSLFPQDRLAVMGLVEPLKRLPELLGIRKSLKQHFLKHRPAVFIGIDAPDFNLNLEKSLRAGGVKTVHYVSPSVWAWRKGRIKTIAKAVDLMLTLLPFEKRFYDDHKVPAVFVGHPLADDIPLEPDMTGARARLGLDVPPDTQLVALLPGSRGSEVERMGTVFLNAARLTLSLRKNLQFLIPAASDKRHEQIKQLLQANPDVPARLFKGQSKDVMAAADTVLINSGTTTLEAMLLKKPMLIAYIVAPLTYWLLKKMVSVKFIGLPNLLAGRPVVPEYIQHAATAEALSAGLLELLEDREASQRMITAFTSIHETLKQNASATAAKAVAALIEGESK